MGVGMIIPHFQNGCEASSRETLNSFLVEVTVPTEGLRMWCWRCLGDHPLSNRRPWLRSVRLVRDKLSPYDVLALMVA